MSGTPWKLMRSNSDENCTMYSTITTSCTPPRLN
jgi:hypothetical protein